MSSASKLLSEVRFASFLVYNPGKERFPSELSEGSRKVMRAVKASTGAWATRQRLGGRLATEIGKEIRDEFLSSDAILIPMPGHAPMKDKGSHWPARELCEHFVRHGLGRQWLGVLERARKVPKSSTSSKDKRPSAQEHFESLSASAGIDVPSDAPITVVDDIVTRGATMIAAISRLKELYPSARIQGFALIRTMSDEEINAIKSPVQGSISLETWGARRRP